MNKLKVFLADDHAILREGLRLIIDSQPDMQVIGEASDGKAALELIPTLNPDIVVMDVSMPEVNGLQATQSLKRMLPAIKVLALTRHSDSPYIQQLLRAGASGYVLKQSDTVELLRALRTIAAGSTYLDPTVAAKLVDSLVERRAKRDSTTVGTLTSREAEVLRLIAQGHSNKEIAAQFQLSVKTVEAHKANAVNKLELHSRVDIVHYALLQGWLQED